VNSAEKKQHYRKAFSDGPLNLSNSLVLALVIIALTIPDWGDSHTSPAVSPGIFKAIDIAPDGSRITLGCATTPCHNQVQISKTTPSGQLAWQRQLRLGDQYTRIDSSEITVDQAGLITALLESHSDHQPPHWTLVRYSIDGQLLWLRETPDTAPGSKPLGFFSDAQGMVFLSLQEQQGYSLRTYNRQGRLLQELPLHSQPDELPPIATTGPRQISQGALKTTVETGAQPLVFLQQEAPKNWRP